MSLSAGLLLLCCAAAAFADPVHVPLEVHKRSVWVGLADMDAAGLSYVAPVTIGTPPVQFSLVLDTGSSDMWVLSAETYPLGQDGLRQFYDHSASSTYVENGASFSIQYGIGWAQGVLDQDVVTLGGLSVPDQVFAEALSVSGSFDVEDSEQKLAVDGILGMAFRALSDSGAPTFLDNLYRHGVVSERVFAFKLGRPEPGFSNSSYLVIGYPNATSYNVSAGLTWNPVLQSLGLSDGTWLVRMQEVRVAGDAVPLCAWDPSGTTCSAIVDTGTSLIGVPVGAWDQIMGLVTANRPDCAQQLGSGGVYVCNSSSPAGFPVVAFNFGGRLFTLEPADYLDEFGLLGFQQVVPQAGDQQFIMGAIFISKFLAVYDMDNRRLAFANEDSTVGLFHADHSPEVRFFGTDVGSSRGVVVAAVALAAGMMALVLLVASHALARLDHRRASRQRESFGRSRLLPQDLGQSDELAER